MGQRSRELKGRRSARQAAQNALYIRQAYGCLFCRTTEGPFVSREHVLPETLGNKDLVLPAGVVCDGCNNGVLAKLDDALCNFFPIKVRRTILGIPSKAGRVPVTRLTTGLLSHTGDGSIRIDINGGRDRHTFREVSRDGNRVAMRGDWSGGPLITARYVSLLSRSLLKVALECAWLDHGPRVYEHRFDQVREVVLGEPRSGFVAYLGKADPDHLGCEVSYLLRNDGSDTHLAVAARLYGITLLTDSVLATLPEPTGPDLQIVRFDEHEIELHPGRNERAL